MQVVLNKDFSILKIEPSSVYQGSHNASFIQVFAPFSVVNYSALSLNIRLPNGRDLSPVPIFATPQQPEGFGVWSTPLSSDVTEFPGKVTFSFSAYSNNGNGDIEKNQSEAGTFEILETPVGDLPDTPNVDVYGEILAAFNLTNQNIETKIATETAARKENIATETEALKKDIRYKADLVDGKVPRDQIPDYFIDFETNLKIKVYLNNLINNATTGIIYKINDDETLTVLNYNGNPSKIVDIPGNFESLANVVIINNSALKNKTAILGVNIDEGVKLIGSEAFFGCDNPSFKNLNIPNSVEKIMSGAFENCGKIETVYLGDSLESLNSYAFKNCTSLDSVSVGNEIKTIQRNAFYNTILQNNRTGMLYLISRDGSVKYLIKNDSDGLSELNTDEKTRVIAGCAFQNDMDLTKVTLNLELKTISEGAFEACKALKEITINEGLETVEGGAFASCESLEKVNISSVRKWCEIDFVDSPHYNPISSPLANSKAKLYLNGAVLSGEIQGLEGLEKISQYAFAKTDISFVNIPESVKTIGEKAFWKCQALCSIGVDTNNPNYMDINGDLYSKDGKTLVCVPTLGYSHDVFIIPDSVKTIFDSAFEDNEVSVLYLLNSVETIGKAAFKGCANLNYVNFSNSVTEIPESCFQNCVALKNVENIPDGITVIGSSAFNNCPSLETMRIPEGVTSIGYNAFENCTKLTEMILPNSVSKIYDSAFKLCSGLQIVTFGNGITNIDDKAFAECTKCRIYDFSACKVIPEIKANTFRGIKSDTKIVVPPELYEEWIASDSWNSVKNHIVKSIVLNVGEHYAWHDNWEITVSASFPNENVPYPRAFEQINDTHMNECGTIPFRSYTESIYSMSTEIIYSEENNTKTSFMYARYPIAFTQPGIYRYWVVNSEENNATIGNIYVFNVVEEQEG